MPHTPGLSVPEPSARAQQSARYDSLAAFAHGVLSKQGHEYPVASLRRQLAAGRMLTKDGEVKADRLNRFMRSLGAKTKDGKPWKLSDEQWQGIADGDSP